jgi:hypothetical protein
VDEGDDPRRLAPDGLLHGVRIEGASQLRLDGADPGAGSPGDLAHATAEDAVDTDHDGVSGLEEVDQAGLHARAARSRDGQGEGIPAAEEPLEALLHLVEHGEKAGIQVADHRLGHGFAHPQVHVAGAGAEEKALRERRDGLHDGLHEEDLSAGE